MLSIGRRASASGDGATGSAEGLLAELQRRGAGQDCYVLSVNEELDGTTGPLLDVVRQVFASVEAPKNRFILHRRALALQSA